MAISKLLAGKKPFLSKKESGSLAVVIFIGLVLLPCLNAFFPKSSFFHVSTFTLSVYGKYLCYAVLALGVNLLWGYTGLLSLGQSLFFALGGYMLGMHLMLMIGAFLGMRDSLLTLIIGSVVGSVVGYLYIRVTHKEASTYELPFGTFLAMGALVVTLIGPTVFEWYGTIGR